MISQILPYLLGATEMVRMSECGTFSTLDVGALLEHKLDPVVAIYPESIELSVADGVSLHWLLHMLGFACLRHKALLTVRGTSSGVGMESAIISIETNQDSFDGIVICRKRQVILILPPPQPSP